MPPVYPLKDYGVAMDVLERFMRYDSDSSRSRCVQTLIPYFGYSESNGIVNGLIRMGALVQVAGASRAFRTVLTKGAGWDAVYAKYHSER